MEEIKIELRQMLIVPQETIANNTRYTSYIHQNPKHNMTQL